MKVRRKQTNNNWPQCLATAVQTGNYTASPGDLVVADATTAPLTVSLPASPSINDIVGVQKRDNTANLVTVDAAPNLVQVPRPNLLTSADLAQIDLRQKDETAYWQWVGTVWMCVGTANMIMPSNGAVLYGSPPNVSPGGSPTTITNWPSSLEGLQFVGTTNPATGEIKAPVAGLYEVTVSIIAHQGNSNKELSILCWLESDLSADRVITVFDIATDKTDYRSFNATVLAVAEADEAFSIGLSWQGDSSPGSMSFEPSLFFLNHRYVL